MRHPALLLTVLSVLPLLPAVGHAGGTAKTLRPELVVQTGHESAIVDAAFSPDGALLASLDASGTVVLWDVEGRRVLRHFTAHEEAGSLAFSGNGRLLATCGKGLVHVWRVSTGARIRTLLGGEYASKRSGAVVFLPGSTQIAVANDQNRFVVHDVRTGKVLRELPGIIAVFHPRQPLYATVQDSTIVLHDVQTGRRVRALGSHPEGIHSLVFSPDGTLLASLGFDVRVWHVASGKLVRKEQLKSPKVALFLDGATLLVSSSNQTQRIALPDGPISEWGDDTYGTYLLSSQRHFALVRAAALALFEVRTAAPLGELEARTQSSSEVVFTPDGQWLLSKGLSEVKLWSMTTARFERRLRGGAKLTVDAAGRLLARADLLYRTQEPSRFEDGQERRGPVIRVTELPTDAPVSLLDTAGEFAMLKGLVFSPSGGELIAGGIMDGGRSLLLAWDTRTWDRAWTIELTGELYALAISPDGKSLALARTLQGVDQLDIVDVAQRQVVRSFQGGPLLMRIPFFYFSEVSFSPDGERVAVRLVPPAHEPTEEEPPLDEEAWDTSSAEEALTSEEENEPSAGDLFPERLVVWNLRTGLWERTTEKAWGGFTADGSLWLWDQRSAVRLEASSGKVLQTLSGSAPSYRGLGTSRDGRWVAGGGSDGRVTLWDARTATEQLSLVGADDAQSPLAYREFVAFTPEGFYLASSGTSPLVAFRVGQRTYSFQQFDAWYNRPDRVMERLGRLSAGEIEQLVQQRKWRLRKLGISPDVEEPSLPTTRVRIDREGLPETTEDTTLTLRVTASDMAAPLAHLYVTVNGVPVSTQKGLGLLGHGERSVTRRMRIPLTPGDNRIAAWAVNRRGLSSLVDELTVRSSAPPETGRLYVVAVGVSVYAAPGHNLTYAAKDAMDLAAFARQRFNRWVDKELPEVIELVDKQATRELILAVRKVLAGTTVNDRVVVFFAGHGLLDAQGGYFFAPHDMDFEQPGRYGVSYEVLEELLAAAPARRKLLLLDTCHAGELKRELPRVLSPSQQARSIPSQARSAVPLEEQSSSQGVLHTEVLDRLFADLRRGSGIAVIAATGGEDAALEDSRWQNGAFTRAVLAAWERPGADTDGNFRVTVSELRDFVGDKVLEMTGGRQRPVARRENLEFDFEAF
jgi:WD40 repeat protein